VKSVSTMSDNEERYVDPHLKALERKQRELEAKEKFLIQKEIEILRRQNEVLQREVSNLNTNSLHYSELKELLHEFNPESNNCPTSTIWIAGLERLAAVHKWTENDKLFAAIKQLRGSAKLWWEGVMTTVTTYQSFKGQFIEGFPDMADDVNIHMLLNQRLRQPAEPIEVYFYDMKSIGKKGNLSDAAIMKYIIRNLGDPILTKSLSVTVPRNLNELLKQLKWSEEISYQQQSSTRSFYAPSSSFAPPSGKVHREQAAATSSTMVRCYNCGVQGHIGKDCRMEQKQERCYSCGEVGHKEIGCTKKQWSTKRVSTINLRLDSQNKSLIVAGARIRSFVDLGSDITTLKEEFAEMLNLEIRPSNVVLKGFGGGQKGALGVSKQHITVDGVEGDVDVYIVPNDSQEQPAIIGRDILDQEHVKIVKELGEFHIFDIGRRE
jgi:hypothetical protein